MLENQYSFFRDLDRRCVAGRLDEAECRSAVRAKRQLIESEMNQANPMVREVLEGKTTFVAEYDAFSRRLRGIRRFVPQKHDPVHNERLRHLAEILPNIGHFMRRSALAADNPLICILYGIIASVGVDIVAAYSMRDDADPGSGGGGDGLPFFLALAFGFVGFVAGTLAMLRYRTRDPKTIHAREAAAYMDLNYAFYRAGDEKSWGEFIRVQSAAGHPTLARPDDVG
jgi:hypothetical protein